MTSRAAATVAEEAIADRVPRGAWRQWAAQLVANVPVEAVIAWLDAGSPDREQAAERLQRVIDAVARRRAAAEAGPHASGDGTRVHAR